MCRWYQNTNNAYLWMISLFFIAFLSIFWFFSMNMQNLLLLYSSNSIKLFKKQKKKSIWYLISWTHTTGIPSQWNLWLVNSEDSNGYLIFWRWEMSRRHLSVGPSISQYRPWVEPSEHNIGFKADVLYRREFYLLELVSFVEVKNGVRLRNAFSDFETWIWC